MKTFLIQGVPPSIAQDGWWLSEPAPQTSPPDLSKRKSAGQLRLGLLVVLIALADVLVWQVTAGLSLAVFCAAVVVLALLAVGRKLTAKQMALIAGLTVLVLLPLVELVQPLSVLIAALGMSAILTIIAGVRPEGLAKGVARLWPMGMERCVKDGVGVLRPKSSTKNGNPITRFAMAWLMPLMLGLIFFLLLADANPILLDWLEGLSKAELPNLSRIAFWLCLAPFGWTVLSLRLMRSRLEPVQSKRPAKFGPARQGLINPGSVTRALVLFNAMFAVQTVLDIAVLYGGVGLPEGMTYATYAHRGAYPLLATALLAGGFALLTRKWTQGNRMLRALLILWVAQNVGLVVSSLVRLDLYVDVYGLTRLRMSAAIWMGLVAAGLALIIWQIWRNHSNGWLMLRGGALGFIVLYACTFVSFDATIARHNLAMEKLRDPHYLCLLGDAAKPVIEAFEMQKGWSLCEYNDRNVTAPVDWREWGYRNMRARHSLNALRSEGTL